MWEKLREYLKASKEYNKHRAEIRRYNKAWKKIKEEQKKEVRRN